MPDYLHNLSQNSTCAVTIYRQTLLPNLDATNPTGTGLLAFLFSTVEIGVAVSLACVPFLRPLFRGSFGSSNRSNPTPGSAYAFSKKGTGSSKPRSQGFNELGDEGGGSEIQLSPVIIGNHKADVHIPSPAVNTQTSWISEDDAESGPAARTLPGSAY